MNNDKYLLMVVFFLLFSLAGCSKKNYPDDEWFWPWRIGAASSYNYPAGVNDAYGVNYEEDWTSIMLPYGGLGSSSRYDMDVYRKYIGTDYDGYALPVGSYVNFTPDQLGSGIKSVPDELYIYWGIHGYRYATVVDVTPQIKAAMLKQYKQPLFENKNCYQTDFLFGLLPDGRAKLWIEGCLLLTYIGEYQPTKAVPVPPPQPAPEPEELTPEQIEQRDKLYEKLGIAELMAEKPKKKLEPPKIDLRPSLDDPIPWDKVNEVWYNPNYTVQMLDDVIPPTSLKVNE